MNKERAPDVSIIIPAYNVEKYICECLESVKCQTLKSYEVIIINDGSTDGTEAAIKEITKGDNRFKLINQENQGPSISRNRGICLARGKFIYFLDSDDSIHPDFLKRCLNFAEEHNLDIVHFNGSVSSEDRRKIEHIEDKNNYLRNLPIIPKNFYRESMILKQYKSPVWLYMIRYDFLKNSDVNFIPGIFHEDESFTLKLVNLSKNQGFLKNVFYKRRIRNDSIMTTSKSIKNYYGYFETFRDLAGWISGTRLAFPENINMLRKHTAMFYMIALRGFVNHGEINKLRILFFKNIRIIFRFVPLKIAIAALFPARIARHLMK